MSNIVAAIGRGQLKVLDDRVEAKSAFGYIAVKQMGYSGREIGRFLNMRSYSAIRRTQEGKKRIDKRGFLWDLAQE